MTTEINKGARTYVTSDSGIRVTITIHKSVRNNWKTTEHRDGHPNVVTSHESRQAALLYARLTVRRAFLSPAGFSPSQNEGDQDL